MEAYRPLPLDVLRESVRRAVEAYSLRHVARQIGLSHIGLKRFIEGAEPYSSTRRRLLHWYVSHAAEMRAVAVSDETAGAALAVLLDGVPPEARPAAMTRLLEAVAQIHQQARIPPPQWVDSLLRQNR
ncbi:MAG: hypothetical protein ACJ8GN_11160 [Longimicrobiaceae bacterium]